MNFTFQREIYKISIPGAIIFQQRGPITAPHSQGSQCTFRFLMRLFCHKWTCFFMSPKESHIFRKPYFCPGISIFYFSHRGGKMTTGIQLYPTGEGKESGQHKYYSMRLDRWRNEKKRSVPPKRVSENKWSCQPQPQVQHHSPKESFTQQRLASGTHTCSFLPPFGLHLLKVKEQEVHSQPDEKATHAFSGGPGGFTFLQISSSSSHKYHSVFSPEPLSSPSMRDVNLPPLVRVSSTSPLWPWFKMVMLMSNPTPLQRPLHFSIGVFSNPSLASLLCHFTTLPSKKNLLSVTGLPFILEPLYTESLQSEIFHYFAATFSQLTSTQTSTYW